MTTRYVFTVEGRGLFPVDMLRYDACWPADGDSAASLCLVPSDTDYRNPRAVRLVSTREPTPARWSSFLWGCGNIQRMRG